MLVNLTSLICIVINVFYLHVVKKYCKYITDFALFLLELLYPLLVNNVMFLSNVATMFMSQGQILKLVSFIIIVHYTTCLKSDIQSFSAGCWGANTKNEIILHNKNTND